METINQSMHPCSCQTSLAKPTTTASQTQLAAVTRSRSLDLNLLTAEGDKVTLSMDTTASAIYAAHGEVRDDGDGSAASWAEFSGGQLEREFAFSVEGDLNRQELREIRKAIKTINRMMHDFVEGRVRPMMNKASKLSGLETIASLDLSMAYEQQVVVAQQTSLATGYDRYGAAAPEARPASLTAPSTVSALPLENESRALAEAMAHEVEQAQAPVADVLEAADRLLKAYRNMVRQWSPLGGQLMDQVHDLFNTAVEAQGGINGAGTMETAMDDD